MIFKVFLAIAAIGKNFYIFNGAGKKNVDLAESIWESLGKEEKRREAVLFCSATARSS